MLDCVGAVGEASDAVADGELLGDRGADGEDCAGIVAANGGAGGGEEGDVFPVRWVEGDCCKKGQLVISREDIAQIVCLRELGELRYCYWMSC